MANVKGYLKDASGNILQPGTDASMVYMQDANGSDSSVQAELAAVRTTVTGLAGLDGLKLRGSVDGTTDVLPASGYAKGDAYVVAVAGTYAGKSCEVADWIVCIDVSTPAADADWSVLQANLVNAVTGPVSSSANNLMAFDNATGSQAKDSGLTISDVSTAVGVGSALDANKTELAKFGEDANGLPTYDGAAVGRVGLPVVENGASVPTNLASGAVYFEKAAVAGA